MKLEIITPDKKLYEGNVKSAVFSGLDGSFGVLNNHAPIIGGLKEGHIDIVEDSNSKQSFPIKGGVVEVLNNKVIVLAE